MSDQEPQCSTQQCTCPHGHPIGRDADGLAVWECIQCAEAAVARGVWDDET